MIFIFLNFKSIIIFKYFNWEDIFDNNLFDIDDNDKKNFKLESTHHIHHSLLFHHCMDQSLPFSLNAIFYILVFHYSSLNIYYQSQTLWAYIYFGNFAISILPFVLTFIMSRFMLQQL